MKTQNVVSWSARGVDETSTGFGDCMTNPSG